MLHQPGIIRPDPIRSSPSTEKIPPMLSYACVSLRSPALPMADTVLGDKGGPLAGIPLTGSFSASVRVASPPRSPNASRMRIPAIRAMGPMDDRPLARPVSPASPLQTPKALSARLPTPWGGPSSARTSFPGRLASRTCQRGCPRMRTRSAHAPCSRGPPSSAA